MYLAAILLALQLVSGVAATPKHFHHHHRLRRARGHIARRQAVSTGQTTPGEHQQTGIIGTCTRWHVAQVGDGCWAVYTAYGITAAQFEAWNPALLPGEDCSLWANYSYCVGIDDDMPPVTTTEEPSITTTTQSPPAATTSPGAWIPNDQVNNCNSWYLVRPGDTCTVLETAFGITRTQLIGWNPTLGLDPACVLWSGYSYCIGTGPLQYTPTTEVPTTTEVEEEPSITVTGNLTYSIRNPQTEITVTSTTMGSAWPPTKTQAGQPTNCNKWHLVRARDNCYYIWAEYADSVTQDELILWNPALGDFEECEGLLYDYWVCVGVRRLTQPNFGGGMAPTDFTIPPVTEYVDTTFAANMTATTGFTWTPSPTLSGLDPACTLFHNATEDDTCDSIASKYSALLTPSEFKLWNPAVQNDCSGLLPANYYCIAVEELDQFVEPPSVTVEPDTVPSDTAANCVKWYQAWRLDTCEDIAAWFGNIDVADLITMNPSLENDCSGLEANTWYCVALPDTPTTRTTTFNPDITEAPTTTSTAEEEPPTTTTTEVPTPSPVQTGIPAGCVRWHQFATGDDCWVIAGNNGISVTTLFALNPATNGCVDAWTGYWMCTGQAQHVNDFPTPNQGDLDSSCTRFYKVQSGDDCLAIAAGAGIFESTLHTLNPNINACVDLWANYYICIGTSLPGTTISTGSALPPATTEPPTTTTTPEPTTTAEAVETPTPTQPGMVSGCVRFYKGVTGYGCEDVALAMGITEADFKLWNPALGQDCAGLWLDHYYCVGLTGEPHTQTVWPGYPTGL